MTPKILVFDEDRDNLLTLKSRYHPLESNYSIEYLDDPTRLRLMLKNQYDVFACKTSLYDHMALDVLDTLKEHHPNTIRIIIADSDQQLQRLQSTGSAHRYLGQDHGVEDIKLALDNIFGLNEIVSNPKLKSFVHNMHSLPTLPYIYTEIMRKLKNPDITAREIGALIEKDISLTAEILRIVNSSYYAIRNKISEPSQAVVMLGLTAVRDIVLSLFLYNHFKVRNFKGISFKSVWNHSLATAGFARKIAQLNSLNDCNLGEVFVAGLLNCVGMLFMAQEYPEDYFQVVLRAERDRILLLDAEESVFEFNHNEMGAYLMGLWGLSDSIVRAIAFSDTIEKVMEPKINHPLIIYLAKRIDFQKHPHWCKGEIPVIDLERLEGLPYFGEIQIWLAELLEMTFDKDVE